MRSNLLSGLRAMLPGQRADRAACALSAMIDGPWLRLGLGDPTIGSARALALAQEYLGGLQAPSQDTPP